MDYISGDIWTPDGPFMGYIAVENGRIAEIGEGRCPVAPLSSGLVMPSPVNAHTHVGDAGLCLERKYCLEDLVAPPNGLKHRHLSMTPREKLVCSMRGFSESLGRGGFSGFIDFREGGIDGCRMLREASPDAVILGRPVSPAYDQDEVDGLLAAADGLGLSGMHDMDYRYIERLADAAEKAGKMFALHVSENRRDDIDAVLALEPDFVVHMCASEKEDVRKCAEAGVPIAVCARSNAYFDLVPPIKQMLDAGACLALGTDNAMICDADSGAELDAFAAVLAAQGGDRLDALRCLAEGGKKILNHGANIGLRTGDEADITVYRTTDCGTRALRLRFGP